MAKGDVVLAKASSGEPIVRRVWAEEADKIVIVHEDYYNRALQQNVAPWTYAVEKTNVFKQDEKLFKELETAYQQKRKGNTASAAQLDKLWTQAKPYTK